MKKTLIFIIALTISTNCIKAQFDGYNRQNNTNSLKNINPNTHGNNYDLPNVPFHNYTTGQDAPIGSGLLILGTMGVGYWVIKKKKQ